ncbi:hypothetical protein Q7M_1082 (plasmid) [Borrelia crocidurae str. Achema]|uniref:Uncharacterized protein n=2 Tax=Borrelia crocidurae TaxID=29520 RepID=I0FE84_BORCA|nr:hypothetical protein Q7M_1082 [Borrelia crocidurae str. Achema]
MRYLFQLEGDIKNMKVLGNLLLFFVLFFCCKDEEYSGNFDLVYDSDDVAFRDIIDSDFDIGVNFDNVSLEKLISDFDLSNEEKQAVRFLRSALTDSTILDDMSHIRTYSDDEFYEFLVILNADKVKEAVADIVLTLKVRDEILDAIYEFADGNPRKDTFEMQLNVKEKEYLKTLKVACCGDSGYNGAYLALKLANHAGIFASLKRQVYDVLHSY